MLPNFIGIGAPKAGTTWLFRCLQEHPEIFVALIKEVNFFHYEKIDGRLNEYEEHFSGAAAAVAIGEISVRYLHSPRAAARIKTYIPDARLFVSLRNPIDQIYSHYWHLRRQNFHQLDCPRAPHSFEDALNKYEDALLVPAYYCKPLMQWLKYFDRSQLHIIFFDDICSRPGYVLSELYAFLGVNNTFVPVNISQTGSSVRRGTSPRSPFHERIHSLLYDHLARRLYYKVKLCIGVRRAQRIKDVLRIRETMEFLFQQKGYPPMSPDTRAFLRDRFAEDIKGIEELTGRDLSHWK